MKMVSVIAAAGFAAFLTVSAQTSSGATLSGAVLFSTDNDGDFYNGSVWNTRGNDSAVNLWVIRGTNHYGAFLNGPSDSQAGISVPLAPGEHTFVVYANQGGFTPHHGLNLFFNGSNSAPRISVFGSTQTSANPPYPTFAANGGSTLTLGFGAVPGANTLVYQEGTTRVELTDFRFANFNVYNIDRVSQRSVTPDGGADFIGQFTLRVTDGAPPPPPPATVYDVSRDFSVTSNPAGAWSYGWAGALDGSFNLLPVVASGPSQNGVIVTFWAKNTYEPAVVYINNSSQTSTSDNGQGNFPPGTVWFYAGPEGRPDNYSVIRFTAPASGEYKLESAVHAFLDGDRSGDTDIHILRNGTEIFGQFLAPRTGTGYTNTLNLAVGDRIDFAVGRGQDGQLYGSGLKIQARFERTSSSPPPPAPSYDLSRDFSIAANPNGPWSYGWLTTLGGAFGRLNYSRTFSADNGVPLAAWQLSETQMPVAIKNVGTATAVSDGGRFTAPPGTVYFSPGHDGTPQNYGAIRFTVPTGGEGDYRIETTVRSLFDGTRSRDADFHVLKDGQELFGQFLSPNSGTAYSNTLHLTAGTTIDFVVGKGADGLTADTGLKIHATLTRSDVPPPPPPPPPPPASTYDVSRDFSTAANPAGPWSYGWKTTLSGSFGLATHRTSFAADNGTPLAGWLLSATQLPSLIKNVGNTTAVSDGGRFTAPPGTVYFSPGQDNSPQNFGVIRFTVPAGAQGDYRIETSVRSLFDGTRSRDADFHVLKDEQELFGQFLPPNSGTGYTNTLSLAAGATIDFVVGKGADGLTADTGLKIQASLTRLDGPPPPPPSDADFDVSRDFSTASNPGGAWAYGYVSALGGPFSTYNHGQFGYGDNPVRIFNWSKNGFEPGAVYFNPSSETSIGNNGAGVYPPKTVYFFAGHPGAPDNYAVIRLTIPAGKGGLYRLESAVRSHLQGTASGDTDFHVLKNGVEIFGQFLPPRSATQYSNDIALAVGDTIDFAVGRGQDGRLDGSGLIIEAELDRIGDGPPPPPPPPAAITLSGLAEFSTDAAGNFYNGSIWSTHDDPYWIVKSWVIHSANLLGPFVNGPSASQAEISIPLAEGEHTFTFFANRGGFTPHHGLNLFFNGNNATPRISVFGATQTSSNSVPPFAANGGNTVTIANVPVRGANTTVFEDGTNRVELINYRFADTSVHNLNRVSQTSTTPDGTTDFIGQFTLRVSKVPAVPAIPRLTGLLEFSTDPAGNFFNGSVWNTRGGDTAVNLWVAKGTDLQAPFVNGPSDAQAAINIQLQPGVNEFVIYGNQGGPTPHHGLNLFFNGNNVNPGISVFGPTQTSPNPPFPPFGPNSSQSTLTLAFQPTPGAGTLVYSQGGVRVTLTQYRWASPPVYNVDRVSQPVATPDGGPDFIGRFTLVVNGPGNSPPSADIALSPRFDTQGAPHALVVACDGAGANIVLDARGSTDPDGDALSYAWFVAGSQQPFSRDAVVRTVADVGVHSVTLRVSDGQSTDDASLTFEVITPAEAAAQLSLMLEAADLSRKNKGPLQQSLRGAIESLEDGKLNAAIGKLGAFENKVQAQLGSSHPELAARLSTATQALIDVLEDCEEAGPGGGN